MYIYYFPNNNRYLIIDQQNTLNRTTGQTNEQQWTCEQ